jgi:hypothetical protein
VIYTGKVGLWNGGKKLEKAQYKLRGIVVFTTAVNEQVDELLIQMKNAYKVPVRSSTYLFACKISFIKMIPSFSVALEVNISHQTRPLKVMQNALTE